MNDSVPVCISVCITDPITSEDEKQKEWEDKVKEYLKYIFGKERSKVLYELNRSTLELFEEVNFVIFPKNWRDFKVLELEMEVCEKLNCQYMVLSYDY